MTDVPRSHPRYQSLRTRDDIVAGVNKGVTSIHGLIAHGRGEAFDYLLGEHSQPFAAEAVEAAAALLLSAQMPDVGGPYPRKKVKSAADFKITTDEF